MQVSDFLMLLGGLSLFLYGMKMMGDGLEASAGNRLKSILEKLTSNRFLGVLVGAGITAIIQSSSATTVMVVGFTNAQLMTLSQTVGVIMGANIGTTITGQLIALDIGAIAPLFAIVGVVLATFVKNKKANHLGTIIAGLGILFIGMELMGNAMVPLRSSETFIQLMTQFSNPLIGILVGMTFTAIIQSSSASIGILQTLALGGLIGLDGAVFVLFGMNIGTCITAILASIGTNRNARRATLVHLFFNIIGTVLFTLIAYYTPFTTWMAAFTPDNPMAQIANTHTLFNVVTTLVLFPFGDYLVKLTEMILPVHEDELSCLRLEYIPTGKHREESGIGSTILVINNLKQETLRMMALAKQNVEWSFEMVLHHNQNAMEDLVKNEELIDYLNKEISSYIAHIASAEMPTQDSRIVMAFFKIIGNIERLGDHAMNIAQAAQLIVEQNLALSEHALDEIQSMRDIISDMLKALLDETSVTYYEMLSNVAQFEQQVDDLTMQCKANQLERIKHGTVELEATMLYSDMLNDFERMGDHILNIAQEKHEPVEVEAL
ncbi:MAG: Na/Pi cotransporter family protein [Erysipelotrichaceae bacterium]